MVDTVRLGKFLYLERIYHEYTQGYVSDVTNISDRTLRNIENGSAELHLDTYWTLCDLYGIPPELGFLFYHRSEIMENNIEILKPELTPTE